MAAAPTTTITDIHVALETFHLFDDLGVLRLRFFGDVDSTDTGFGGLILEIKVHIYEIYYKIWSTN